MSVATNTVFVHDMRSARHACMFTHTLPLSVVLWSTWSAQPSRVERIGYQLRRCCVCAVGAS
eukprot:908748-Lingulodinium_polyedra.AAC.1